MTPILCAKARSLLGLAVADLTLARGTAPRHSGKFYSWVRPRLNSRFVLSANPGWKQFERRCSRDFGAERIPVTEEHDGTDGVELGVEPIVLGPGWRKRA